MFFRCIPIQILLILSLYGLSVEGRYRAQQQQQQAEVFDWRQTTRPTTGNNYDQNPIEQVYEQKPGKENIWDDQKQNYEETTTLRSKGGYYNKGNRNNQDQIERVSEQKQNKKYLWDGQKQQKYEETTTLRNKGGYYSQQASSGSNKYSNNPTFGNDKKPTTRPPWYKRVKNWFGKRTTY